MIGSGCTSGRFRPAGVALVAMTFATAAAWAAPPLPGRVVLLDRAGSSQIARHCLTRIREELVAGGFEVATVDPGLLRDPVAIASVMERQDDAVATIALVGDLKSRGPSSGFSIALARYPKSVASRRRSRTATVSQRCSRFARSRC